MKKSGLIGLMAMAVASAAHGEPSHSAASTAPAAAVDTAAQLERNKDVVRAVFGIINGTSLDDIAKIDRLVAEDYIQHNPVAGQGREGLRAFLHKIVPAPKELSPSNTLSVNFIAEGDYVVRQEMRKDGMLIDIFRVKDGLLQEHWDAFRFAPGAKRIPGF